MFWVALLAKKSGALAAPPSHLAVSPWQTALTAACRFFQKGRLVYAVARLAVLQVMACMCITLFPPPGSLVRAGYPLAGLAVEGVPARMSVCWLAPCMVVFCWQLPVAAIQGWCGSCVGAAC